MPRTDSGSSVLSREVLEAALEGLEAQRRRIDEQIRQVRAMVGVRGPGRPAKAGDSSAATSVTQPPNKRHAMSAAARRRIAEAQKKRWAEFREAKGPAQASAGTPNQPKRRISAAGRKRIAEAARKRWAEFRKKSKG